MNKVSIFLMLALSQCQAEEKEEYGGSISSIFLSNDTERQTTVFVSFNHDSKTRAEDWPFCSSGVELMSCSFTLEAGESQVMAVMGRLSVVLSFDAGGAMVMNSTVDLLDITHVDWLSNKIQIWSNSHRVELDDDDRPSAR